jgi:hypothetical protein
LQSTNGVGCASGNQKTGDCVVGRRIKDIKIQIPVCGTHSGSQIQNPVAV